MNADFLSFRSIRRYPGVLGKAACWRLVVGTETTRSTSGEHFDRDRLPGKITHVSILAVDRNATTGARVSSLQTNSQITSLIWSPHSKEILATHGFPNHAISLWAYPSGQKVGELQQAHDMRILTSALSPDGCTVVTGAGDENLKVSEMELHESCRLDYRLMFKSDLAVLEDLGTQDWVQEQAGRAR